MNTNEPRYYDPETGEHTRAAELAVAKCLFTLPPGTDMGRLMPMSSVPSLPPCAVPVDPRVELARIQRERDEARQECDRVRTEWEKCECAWHDELNTMVGDLTTERAAREKAERERNEARARIGKVLDMLQPGRILYLDSFQKIHAILTRNDTPAPSGTIPDPRTEPGYHQTPDPADAPCHDCPGDSPDCGRGDGCCDPRNDPACNQEVNP